MISSVFAKVSFPSLKEIAHDKSLLRKEIIRISNVIILVCLPISIIFLFFSNELAVYLWGDEWARVGQILPYFSMMILMQASVYSLSDLILLFNRERKVFLLGLVTSISQILFVILAISQGISQVAFFLAIANTSLNWIFILIYVFKNIFECSYVVILKNWLLNLLSINLILIGLYLELPKVIEICSIVLCLNLLYLNRNLFFYLLRVYYTK